MRTPEMFFARIDLGLMERVIMPALTEYAENAVHDPRLSNEHRVEAVYTLARMRQAMNQNMPGGFIREPNPVRLANAARGVRRMQETAT